MKSYKISLSNKGARTELGQNGQNKAEMRKEEFKGNELQRRKTNPFEWQAGKIFF